MLQKTSQMLYAYWNGVRGERLAPRRFEIEPARIAPILPETFILERIDSESFVYRLAGTKLCEQFGTEFRGTNFLDHWGGDDRAHIVQHLNIDCHQGAVIILAIEASANTAERESTTFEIALMPLVHASSSVSRYLGAMSAIQSPDWLGSVKLVNRRLIDRQILWPDGRPQSAQDRYRTNQAPLLASLAGARLVKSDRRTFRVLDGGLAGTHTDDT